MANNLTVTYKGNTIHTASASGSATLETGGTWCEDDIGLNYTFEPVVPHLDVTITNGTATNVIATKDGTTILLNYSSSTGKWSAYLEGFGVWTVAASNSSYSQTDTINIDKASNSISLRLQDVPNAYIQLEYIQFNRQNGIDINYSPKSSTKITGRMAQQRSSQWDNWFISDEGSTAVPRRLIALELNPGNMKMRYMNGYIAGSSGIAFVDTSVVSVGTIYSFSTSNRTITFNGVNYTVTQGSAITSASGASMLVGGGCRTYKFTVQEENASTLARNLIPAKRNSDSAVGFYDKAGGKFYYSSGAIAGPSA